MDSYADPVTIVDTLISLIGSTQNVDLLKIDVDNGDCSFLKEVMSNFKPKFISIEVTQCVLPPQFFYMQLYDPVLSVDTEYQYSSLSTEGMRQGCSLGAIHEITKEDYFIIVCSNTQLYLTANIVKSFQFSETLVSRFVGNRVLILQIISKYLTNKL